MAEPVKQSETGAGEETAVERVLNRYVGQAIHLFLSLLAICITAAAIITAVDTVIRDFPLLWQPTDEYSALLQIIQNILLIAIAAEFGLLLLYHRTSAAIEVVIFVIARKMVSPDITVPSLLMGAAALSGLVILRFYFLPGKPK